MNKLSASLTALALTVAAASSYAGDITGKITLKGTPPPETPIKFDQNCGAFHTTPVSTRRYVVSSDGGLANVFVYISKGAEGKKFDAPTAPVLLDQKGCMYQPYIVGAMVNQPIQIKNSDPILHNVHALPKDSSEEFNFAQPLQGQTDERKFTKPQVLVKVKCDVHDWMLAYVGVVDNPFFAITDESGKFTIKNVPPGDYTLTAYHLKAHGTKPGETKTIKVEGAPVTADFTVEVPK
ncbi:MAG: carboxypeptidase regulatory-like domain-containing protein [Limisphaerales bacterium]